jgi:hypothetical protein
MLNAYIAPYEPPAAKRRLTEIASPASRTDPARWAAQEKG